MGRGVDDITPWKPLPKGAVCVRVYTSTHLEVFMPDSTTLTVRLSNRTKERLAELAGRTRRTRSFLAAEAIADYVTRELAAVEGIERGQADVRAGRVTPHDDVAREAYAIIEAARTAR